MCFECRVREELIKHIGNPIHLANIHASAVYKNLIDGVKSKKEHL